MKLKWVQKEARYGEIESLEAVEGDWRLLVVHLEANEDADLEECWEWRVGNRRNGNGDSDIADTKEEAMHYAEDAMGSA